MIMNKIKFNSHVMAAVFALAFSAIFVMSAVGPAINVAAPAIAQGHIA